MTFLNSVWSVQHPNAGQNIQHLRLFLRLVIPGRHRADSIISVSRAAVVVVAVVVKRGLFSTWRAGLSPGLGCSL